MERIDAFKEYAKLLIKLHICISRGEGSSMEAIHLREQMEVPEGWLMLCDIETLNEYSALLYDLWEGHDTFPMEV